MGALKTAARLVAAAWKPRPWQAGLGPVQWYGVSISILSASLYSRASLSSIPSHGEVPITETGECAAREEAFRGADDGGGGWPRLDLGQTKPSRFCSGVLEAM